LVKLRDILQEKQNISQMVLGVSCDILQVKQNISQIALVYHVIYCKNKISQTVDCEFIDFICNEKSKGILFYPCSSICSDIVCMLCATNYLYRFFCVVFFFFIVLQSVCIYLAIIKILINFSQKKLINFYKYLYITVQGMYS
jgi:hypothetical protein